MTGRRPLPTAVKQMRGNPGKRPLNAAEPKPDATMPHAPAHLTREARAEWRRVAKRLHNAGVLTYIDRGVLAVYCQAYGRWVEAEGEIDKRGSLMETPSGYMQQSPWVGIANKAMEQMLRAGRELGLTPASRSSIKTDKPTESLADLLFAGVDDE